MHSIRIKEIYKYVYTYTDNMSTKTIAILEEVYDILKSLQKPGESFSQEIRRLVSDRGTISQFAGAWDDVGNKEAEEMLLTIKKSREHTRLSREKKLA